MVTAGCIATVAVLAVFLIAQRRRTRFYREMARQEFVVIEQQRRTIDLASGSINQVVIALEVHEERWRALHQAMIPIHRAVVANDQEAAFAALSQMMRTMRAMDELSN